LSLHNSENPRKEPPASFLKFSGWVSFRSPLNRCWVRMHDVWWVSSCFIKVLKTGTAQGKTHPFFRRTRDFRGAFQSDPAKTRVYYYSSLSLSLPSFFLSFFLFSRLIGKRRVRENGCGSREKEVWCVSSCCSDLLGAPNRGLQSFSRKVLFHLFFAENLILCCKAFPSIHRCVETPAVLRSMENTIVARLFMFVPWSAIVCDRRDLHEWLAWGEIIRYKAEKKFDHRCNARIRNSSVWWNSRKIGTTWRWV
jgi:hypothetical protein